MTMFRSMDSPTDDIKEKRFLWGGVLLAWGPLVVFLIGVSFDVVRSISANRATGLGAVAGGLYGIFQIATVLAFEVGALVLLVRSFSRGHSLRNAFVVLSICASVLMIFLFGFAACVFYYMLRYRH